MGYYILRILYYFIILLFYIIRSIYTTYFILIYDLIWFWASDGWTRSDGVLIRRIVWFDSIVLFGFNCFVWCNRFVWIQLFCFDAIVLFGFNCFVLMQSFCLDSIVLFWCNRFVLIQLFCLDSIGLFEFNCFVWIQLFCLDSIVLFGFNCFVWIQLFCFDSIVLFWFSCFVLIMSGGRLDTHRWFSYFILWFDLILLRDRYDKVLRPSFFLKKKIKRNRERTGQGPSYFYSTLWM
jgi:hypothetical protein